MAVGLVRDERRGLATSLNAVSMQIPRSFGPSLAGYLLDMGFFTAPFVAGAFLQAAYVFLYARMFRNYDAGGKKSVPPQRTRGAEKEGFSTNTEEEAETPL